eukprot:1250156-Heterocapsa_arctica.AAC.2
MNSVRPVYPLSQRKKQQEELRKKKEEQQKKQAEERNGKLEKFVERAETASTKLKEAVAKLTDDADITDLG